MVAKLPGRGSKCREGGWYTLIDMTAKCIEGVQAPQGSLVVKYRGFGDDWLHASVVTKRAAI